MKAAEKSQYKAGTCKWCGDKGTVFRDNGYCDDCDSDVVGCSICAQDIHIDNRCRHVFKDANSEWAGAGVRVPSGDGYDRCVKDAFFKLLGLMPPDFPDALRKAIRSGKFHTWSIMPLIGGGGIFEMHGMDYEVGRRFGDALCDIGGSDNAEETSDGYRWLVSLYSRDTLKANRATIAWIDEHKALAAKERP